MKKRILVPIITVLYVSLLSGCTGKDSFPSSDAQHTASPLLKEDVSAETAAALESYQKLVAFKTEAYEQQSVAAFNQLLARDNGDISGLLDAQAEVLTSLSPDDENYEFITVTLAASLGELYCEQMDDNTGFSVYLKSSEAAGTALLNALYRLRYTLSDPAGITIAERDNALQCFKIEFQTYANGLKEDDLTSSAVKTILSEKAEELAREFSTSEIQLSCEIESVEVHSAGAEIVNE